MKGTREFKWLFLKNLDQNIFGSLKTEKIVLYFSELSIFKEAKMFWSKFKDKHDFIYLGYSEVKQRR